MLIAAVLGTVAMWSQESDLSTTPSITEVTRIYESRDETSLLSVVGIDPSTVNPLPSYDNQILQVQEQASREKIAEETGVSSEVTITRSEQRFSLLNTAEGDGKTKFTFLSVGTPTYTFHCSDDTADTCNTAIDAYVAALAQVRKDSIVAGMQRVKSLLQGVAQNGSVSAQEKIAGIDAALPLITGELALLSTSEDQYGGTISTVKKSTYAFGFAAGALIGLLIALQLTIIDKRIRSLSQLTKFVETADLVGHVTKEPVSLQHVSAALVSRAQQLSVTSLTFMPASRSGNTAEFAQRVHEITQSLGVAVTAKPSVSSVNAQELLAIGGAVVIVANAKHSTSTEVVDTWSVLSSAKKSVLGVVLADNLK
ncbi:MAG: hypothetical protein EBR53_01925 [Actinobacteria bacterium]|nr:hypothetical protein [Actinomycetota bacterium]